LAIDLRTSFGGRFVKYTLGKLVGVISIVFFIVGATNTVNAIGVTSTITVGMNPEGIAYDAAKGEIFVSSMANNTVSVISDNNNTVIKTINVGNGPRGLVYDSGKGEIFVTSVNDGKVYVIDDDTNQVVANVTVGYYPSYAAYDSGKGEIFVSNVGSGTVSVISDKNNTVVATVNLVAVPTGNFGTDLQPQALCYDSGKGEIFVPCREGDAPIHVISDSNNTVIATILLPGTAIVREPEAACYDPSKGEIFVGNADNTVFIISDTNNTIVDSIHTLGGPVGFVYDSGKGYVFLANQYDNSISANYNSVSVISDTNNTIIETIGVGKQPKTLAYDSAKGEIFVANSYVNTVSVISDSASVPNQPGNNNNNGGQQNNNGGNSGKKSTPGFELLIVLGALAFVLFLKRKRLTNN
jgi:YVTN family beta-propeller protein